MTKQTSTSLEEIEQVLGDEAGPLGVDDLSFVESMISALDAREALELARANSLQNAIDTYPEIVETIESAQRTPLTEAVASLSERGFVKKPAKISTAINEHTRDAHAVKYDDGVVTERQALVELSEFLEKIERFARRSGDMLTSQTASAIRSSFTFIGHAEYKEACAGLAGSWAHYLEEDPERQIVLFGDIGSHARYRETTEGPKSDVIVRNSVVDELAEISEKDVLQRVNVLGPTDLKKLHVDPEKTRIIVLDDWTISGGQADSVLSMALALLDERYYGSLEAQYLAAPNNVIKNGFQPSTTIIDNPPSIPVSAYYAAHGVKKGNIDGYNACISGAHSSVNRGFSETLERLMKLFINSGHPSQGNKIKLPALARIVRD